MDIGKQQVTLKQASDLASKLIPAQSRLLEFLEKNSESGNLDMQQLQPLIEKCKSTQDVLDALASSDEDTDVRTKVSDGTQAITSFVGSQDWLNLPLSDILIELFKEKSSLKLQMEESRVTQMKKAVCAGRFCFVSLGGELFLLSFV